MKWGATSTRASAAALAAIMLNALALFSTPGSLVVRCLDGLDRPLDSAARWLGWSPLVHDSNQMVAALSIIIIYNAWIGYSGWRTSGA